MSLSQSKQIKPWDPATDGIDVLIGQYADLTPAPSEHQLALAPTLCQWTTIEQYGLRALSGVVYGHADVTDGTDHITSPLIKLDDEGRWARTVNRYYRLSESAPS